ncbi:imidazole glycerol phosphate synthase subunit HisH [Hazenella sp. IB182357]|uniref:Imidazole glycerol phosphate synthase subunit HisH n=1 Tax=Polycladospora coralii TaxID=2771432 RepID=A0A926N9I6_9BACL|nr:imidazole glycerol phosphate synthase subunit HisH [Polycladospora coralii]MBD1372233.1 imidazole glycerol phosphate synthase subunit HisH [Polycladospora coralii]MBS7530732.1 imidazole glycerol phosphate synthase subunit HisH [Polycladospora coralii]
MLAIIDLGVESEKQIGYALRQMKIAHVYANTPEKLADASHIILTATGSFKDAMQTLVAQKLDQALFQHHFKQKPLLGIGLGMHLLFTSSDEDGYFQGLNFIHGHIIPIDHQRPCCPHQGWEWLSFKYPHPLLKGLSEENVYYDHLYHARVSNNDDVIAHSESGQSIQAIVARNHNFGIQFQPEKSGDLGLQLLYRFSQINH